MKYFFFLWQLRLVVFLDVAVWTGICYLLELINLYLSRLLWLSESLLRSLCHSNRSAFVWTWSFSFSLLCSVQLVLIFFCVVGSFFSDLVYLCSVYLLYLIGIFPLKILEIFLFFFLCLWPSAFFPFLSSILIIYRFGLYMASHISWMFCCT